MCCDGRPAAQGCKTSFVAQRQHTVIYANMAAQGEVQECEAPSVRSCSTMSRAHLPENLHLFQSTYTDMDTHIQTNTLTHTNTHTHTHILTQAPTRTCTHTDIYTHTPVPDDGLER